MAGITFNKLSLPQPSQCKILTAAEAATVLCKFVERPLGYEFTRDDIGGHQPQLNHNLWDVDFLRAQLAAARSRLLHTRSYTSVVIHVSGSDGGCPLQ